MSQRWLSMPEVGFGTKRPPVQIRPPRPGKTWPLTILQKDLGAKDEEAIGSNPATPTSSNVSLSYLAERSWGPNRGPLPHAELARCRLKMMFMVSAPRVITGLSWCRPERTVKHVLLRATDCPLMPLRVPVAGRQL